MVAPIAFAPLRDPKPSRKRQNKKQLSKKPADRVFTNFMKLPPELRVMIWDIALDEFTILHVLDCAAGRVRDGKHHWTLVRHGFNPGNIALSCHEAAARWAHFYPLRKWLPDDSPVRVRVDRTILFADCWSGLMRLLGNGSYTYPRLLAYKASTLSDPRLPFHMRERRTDGKRIKHGVERVFEIESSRGRSIAYIMETLAGRAETPEDAGPAYAIDCKGHKWLQEQQVIASYRPAFDDEESIASDSEELSQ